MLRTYYLIVVTTALFIGTVFAGEKYTVSDPFDKVRESVHICHDGRDAQLLSIDIQPDHTSCSAYYAACEGDKCMTVVHGTVKRFEKGLLLSFGADVLAATEPGTQAAPGGIPLPGGGGGGGGVVNPWSSPLFFSDPFCSWYSTQDFINNKCTDVPGGGPHIPPGSTPLPPGENDNCYLCTLTYLACFSSAQLNLIQQYHCTSRFRSCTKQRCG